jgi:hypothetical protein
MVPDAAYPQLTSKNFTVMGMNRDNLDLFGGLNEGVAWLSYVIRIIIIRYFAIAKVNILPELRRTPDFLDLRSHLCQYVLAVAQRIHHIGRQLSCSVSRKPLEREAPQPEHVLTSRPHRR